MSAKRGGFAGLWNGCKRRLRPQDAQAALGRAAQALGKHASDVMTPVCSCHDPIMGFYFH